MQLRNIRWAIAILLGNVALAAEFPKDPADWAPADCLVMVAVDDVDRLATAVRDLKGMNRYFDPASGPAFGEARQFRELTSKVLERLALVLDTPKDQLKSPFGGPAVFYLAGAQVGDAPDAVLMAGLKDVELAQRYVDAALKKLRETASDVKTESVGSDTIHFLVHRPKGDSDDEDGSDFDEFEELERAALLAGDFDGYLDSIFSAEKLPEELAICLSGRRLIVASSIDAARKALRIEREAPLSRQETYRTLSRRFEPLGQVRIIVNGAELWKQIKRETQRPDEIEEGRKLGIDTLQMVFGHVRLGGGDGAQMVSEGVAYTGTERKGLFRLLSFENKPIDPPPSIGSDSKLFVSVAFSPMELIDRTIQFMRVVDPDEAQRMESGLENMPLSESETVNIRKEVLEKLDGPLSWTVDLRKPYSVETTRFYGTLGLRDRDAIVRFLSKVPLFTQREVRGVPVFDLPMGGLSILLRERFLNVGPTSSVLSGLDSSSTSRLAESAAFRRAKRHGASEAWLVAWWSGRELMQAMLDIANSDDLSSQNSWEGIVLQSLTTEMRLDESERAIARKNLEYNPDVILTVSTLPDGIGFKMVSFLSDD